MRSLQFGYFWGELGAGAQAYQTYNYCLSVCKYLELFVAKLLRKSRKFLKKFSGPLVVTFGTNEVVQEYTKKHNFRIVWDKWRSQKH